jgi:HEAT repeat protein
MLCSDEEGTRGGDALLDLVNDPDPEVRWVVARGLSQVDPEALRPLIVMLRDPNKDVRVVAASALGFSHTPQAIAALEEATKDDEEVVCLVARIALKKIKAAQEKK